MIYALDIETIPNPDTFHLMPEVEAKKNLKDPAKIAADIADKKAAQHDKAALDPLTGRVCAIAYVGLIDGKEVEHVDVIDAATDEAETIITQSAMKMLGKPESRIITWNGIGFDLPYIYKRAMVLGINPANFDAPPLTAWTKRYSNERHYDLMQIWGAWKDMIKLDTVAGLVLGDKKIEIDFATFAALIETQEGRAKLGEYCLQDTRLTWRLFDRMNGTMFV